MNAQPPRLRELAAAFFQVGCTSFGGPIVAMGLIHREAVERRRWVSPEWFASTLGLLEAVPGPSATEMSVSVGIARRGRLGGIVSGLAYVLPGFFAMLALSAAYFRFGSLPSAAGAVSWLKPAAVAVLSLVCLRLARAVLKDKPDFLFAAASCAACLAGLPLAYSLLAAGALRLALERRPGLLGIAPLAWLGLPPEGAGRLARLFAGMFKAGAMVSGGGYVIASFLSQDFVARKGWISAEDFLAGLALAQFKPGPIILLSVFVGYKAAGLAGALLSAFAVFLPCFGTLLALGPSIERLRTHPELSVFLRGMGAAAIGSLVAVSLQLLLAAVRGPAAAAVYLAGLAGLSFLAPGWVLAAASASGLILGRLP